MALCLALLFTPLLSKAQTIDSTGNLVNFSNQANSTTSTWQNAGTIGEPLTCWSGGDSGYCGPLPRVAAWGPGSNVINFSYGLTNLNQIVNVSNALASAGNGLQVNGFTFGFTAKNGNGWDDGRQDYLTAYVNVYNNTNSKILESYNYNMNARYNWTQFSYSETFNKPYPTPELGNINYGFIGRDNNFWVGPYGPEIMSVNFSLKYSVDPCATNTLSSPSCSGYFDALAKLAPKATTNTTTETTPTGTVPVIDGIALTPTGNYGGTLPPPPGSPPPPEGSQPPPQSGPMQPGPPMPGPTQQAAASQPSANNPQAKVGEVSDSSGSSKASSPVSLSSVLNMISSNQEKTSALEKSVVQAADAQAFSAGETAKQQAEKIAGDVQSQSIANSGSSQTSTSQSSTGQSSVMQMQGSVALIQGNLQSNTTSNTARLQQSLNSSNTGIQSESTTQNVTGYQQNNIQQSTRQDFNVSIVTPAVSYSISAPNRYVPQTLPELPTTEGIKFGGYKGPVYSAMESKAVQPQTNQNQPQTSSVNKNAQDNDAAGGVTIDSIAKQPIGYALYFNALADAAFYAPKEVYKNQKTVDNVRALRQLSSDRLHQQMVDQQYK